MLYIPPHYNELRPEYTEVVTMPILPFGDKNPKIDAKAYISPQATIVGDVEIGQGVSVWPGAVIRGDQASVRIGENTCIQDSVVVHAHTDDNPAIIGNLSVVGSASVIHGVYMECTSETPQTSEKDALSLMEPPLARVLCWRPVA